MQSKLRNSNRSLEDRGWQAMREILDREMPVSGESFRRLWWYILPALMLLTGTAGISAWYLHEQRDTSQPPAKEIQEEIPVAAIEPSVDHTSDQPGTDLIPKSLEVKDHIPLDVKEKQLYIPNIDIFESGHINKEEAISTSEVLPAADLTASEDQTGRKHNPSMESAFDDSATYAEAREVFDRPAYLPRIDVTVPEFHRSIPAVIAVSGIKSRPELHISALFHSNPMHAIPFYGVEAGVHGSFRITNRLRLKGGISYTYYNIDGIIGSTAFSFDRVESNLPGGQDPGQSIDLRDVYASSLSYDASVQLVEQFHYLNLPVTFEYRLVPRLAVIAGFRASAMIGAPARYRLDDQTRFATSGTAAGASRDFLYQYDNLRKFDVAPLVGISWHMGRDLYFDVAYAHGLAHYINASVPDQREDFHRSLSAGLRYRLL